MEMLKEYAEKFGIPEVINDFGERRTTKENSIVFPNGWVASIVKQNCDAKYPQYSVAMCDYNGYFNWSILDKHGAFQGCFYCYTELDIIIACETIRRLSSNSVSNKAQSAKMNDKACLNQSNTPFFNKFTPEVPNFNECCS